MILSFFFSMIRLPPLSSLFPYTTLFRSRLRHVVIRLGERAGVLLHNNSRGLWNGPVDAGSVDWVHDASLVRQGAVIEIGRGELEARLPDDESSAGGRVARGRAIDPVGAILLSSNRAGSDDEVRILDVGVSALTDAQLR